MTQSYWDLYVAYVNKCATENWVNDVDPAHYEMEWNHFLPQNIFGDWQVGQWLTIRQHAIASALQTMAFRKNCMHGKHKHYLPDVLRDLCWHYYETQCKANGCTTAKRQVGCHSPGIQSAAGKVGGRKAALTNRRNGTGIFDPAIRELSHAKSRKPVQVTNLNNGEKLVFESIREASLSLGLDRKNLSKVCGGHRKQTGGYIAEFITHE